MDDIGNADFAFYADTVYYPDANTSFRYKALNDSISIFVDGNKIQQLLIIKNTIDSLILNYQDVNVIMRYGKRK